MKVSRIDATIRLTAEEGAAFLGKGETTPEMLTDVWASMRGRHSYTYKSFRERVESVAEGIHEESKRTVEIYMDGVDGRIAYWEKASPVLQFEPATNHQHTGAD